jgi:hypothetical protein
MGDPRCFIIDPQIDKPWGTTPREELQPTRALADRNLMRYSTVNNKPPKTMHESFGR